MKLTTNDVRVLDALTDLLKKETDPITYNLLKEVTWVNVRTIHRSLKRLTESGYITMDRPGAGWPYTYEILNNNNNREQT